MKRMLIVAAAVAAIAAWGDDSAFARGTSAAMRLDLRTGTRIATEGAAIPIAYSPRWGNAASCTVAETGKATLVAAATEEGTAAWTPSGTGAHTLTYTADGETLTAQFTVLGDDVAVHKGTLGASETWGTDKVHLVTAAVVVPSGVSLTIQSGVVVKFMPGASLTVAGGGSCTARGVIFTHVNDDTVGGDTLFDGDSIAPTMGDYTITGSIIDDDSTEYRYMPPQTLTSSISSNTRLRGYRTYIVSNSVTVASGATLTLQPGTILKFNTGCSLTVNGTLNAQGTRAQPIVFTSLKDDAHGGDTNGDGENSFPDMGDWKNIAITGNVNFSHVKCLYGGGASNSSDTGMLAVRSGGKLSLDCCLLAHGLYDGVFSYGTVTGENTIIYDCDRGVNTSGGIGVFRNCVVDYCRWGVMAEGGSGTYYNCIITRFFGSNAWPTGWGVAYWSGSLKTYNCCVWSTLSGASNYRSSPTAVRNMSVDPLFLDPDNGDFRIAENSPCINAGDAANAPEFDYYGQPRNGVPDIGIYEVQGDTGTGYDLAATMVNAQAARSTIGETITVSYGIANVGRLAVTDPWHDALYLVSSTSGKQYALGEPLNPGGIGAGETRTFTSQFALPVVPVGQYRLRLVVNSRRMDVPEGAATENNVLVSEGEIEVVADSVDAADGASGSVAAGASAVCAFTLPSGSGDRLMRVTSTAGGVSLSARCGLGFLPVNADAGTTLSFSGGAAWISVPAGTEEVWLVLDNCGTAAAPYEVEFIDGSLTLSGITPALIPSSGNVTVEIAGAGFTDACEVSFIGAGTVAPLSVKRVSQGLLSATVDAAAFVSGKTYSVAVKKGTETKTLQDALSVAAAPGKPKFWAKLDMPSSMRQGRLVETCFIEYGNSGTADMLSPVLQVSMTGDGTLGYIGGLSGLKTLQFIAAGEKGSAGVLRPGSSHRIRFAVRAGANNKILLHTSEGSDYAPAPWTNAADYLSDLSAAATRIDLRGQDATDYEEVQSLARRVKAGEGVAVIYGRLTDVDGSAIANAFITFTNTVSESVVSAVSDSNGRFQTQTIKDGTYLAKIAGIPLSEDCLVTIVNGEDVGASLVASDAVRQKVMVKGSIEGLVAIATEIETSEMIVGRATETGFEFRGLSNGNYCVEILRDDKLVFFSRAIVEQGVPVVEILEYDGSEPGTLILSTDVETATSGVAFLVMSNESGFLNFIVAEEGTAEVTLTLPAGNYDVMMVVADSDAVNSNSVIIASGETKRVSLATSIIATAMTLSAPSIKAANVVSLTATPELSETAQLKVRMREAVAKARQLASVPLNPPAGDRDCIHNRENLYPYFKSYRDEYLSVKAQFEKAFLDYEEAEKAYIFQNNRFWTGTAVLGLKAAIFKAYALVGVAYNGVEAAVDAAMNGATFDSFCNMLEIAGVPFASDAAKWRNKAKESYGLIKDFASRQVLQTQFELHKAVMRSKTLPAMELSNQRFEQFLINNDNYAYWECCPMVFPEQPYDPPVDNKTPSVPKSWDPNEMVGEEGVGDARYVKPGQELTYTIYFENKAGFDIADAQEVKVTNPLSEWLNWSTFEMREVAFNNQCDVNLDGLANGTSEVQMNGTNKYVRTTVECNAGNGVVTWYMRVYDPNGDSEGYPLDGSGFLPSNDDTHRGEGHITYRIKVRDDASANVVITNSASIVFDLNDPIETDPAWWNTVAQAANVKLNGDVEGDVADLDLIVGAPYGELPTPKARTGYAFGGWYTGPNGMGRRVTAQSLVSAGDSGLYAYWIAIPPPPADPDPVAPPPAIDSPVLWERGADVAQGSAPSAAASVYDGYLYDRGSGAVAGTIQVKVGKPNAKTGLAGVSATVTGLDGKKKKLKADGNGKVAIASDGPTTMRLVGGESCVITLGAEGLSGTYGSYQIDGARNFFTSKDKGEQNAANDILAKWIGAVNVVWDGGNASVTIGKKGKAKVAVTLANGTKATANAQMLVGEEWLCVPVVVTKKANLAFTLWLPRSGGEAVVTGLGDDVVAGKPGALKAGAKFRIDADAFSACWGQRALPYLPDGMEVTQSGAKWTLPKAGKVQKAKDGTIDASKLGDNPSGLKLTYKAKDGSFKGSFKAYADNAGKLKATTVNVTGVVVNGVGYGTASIKKVGSVEVRIE